MELETGMKFYFSPDRAKDTTFIIKIVKRKLLEDTLLVLALFDRWDDIEKISIDNHVGNPATYKQAIELIDTGWWHRLYE